MKYNIKYLQTALLINSVEILKQIKYKQNNTIIINRSWTLLLRLEPHGAPITL